MAPRGLGLCTAREVTAEEQVAAVAMVQRRAVSAEDEQLLLDALGITVTDTVQGDQ